MGPVIWTSQLIAHTRVSVGALDRSFYYRIDSEKYWRDQGANMSKNLRLLQSEAEYLEKWSKMYQDMNYQSGLVAYFLRRSHAWAEQALTDKEQFRNILEVGAGSGAHLKYVSYEFDAYVATDINEVLLGQATGDLPAAVRIEVQDATSLTYEDDSFDRLVATHILEHLERPHEVLEEWARVVRPGGVLTILLPCDPGILWRLGRRLFARKRFIDAEIDYDYWIAREHINPVNNLIALIRSYFTEIEESWEPMKIPSIDLNLFYIVNIRL